MYGIFYSNSEITTPKLFARYTEEGMAVDKLEEFQEKYSWCDFELGECDKNARAFWNGPIYWQAVNGLRLNEFYDYKRLLFTPEERLFPNCWEKFVKYSILDDSYAIGVYVPFPQPETIREYHLNHYVYWSVIAYLEMEVKPLNFFSYNSGKVIKPAPKCFCFACEYDKHIHTTLYEHTGRRNCQCDHCPMWPSYCACEEDDDSPFKEWVNNGSPKAAKRLAEFPWHSFDYEIAGFDN